jgi:hypothetical protein
VTDRAAALIVELELQPHPEGGYFREVFRSGHPVRTVDDRGERAALTTIYFLLPAGQISQWHRVLSDEVWHYYEGDPLELLWLDIATDADRVHRCVLGPVGDKQRPVHVVPAGCWQSTRPLGAYALVGCTVAPGFDFADFTMASAGSPDAEAIRRLVPDVDGLLE